MIKQNEGFISKFFKIFLSKDIDSLVKARR